MTPKQTADRLRLLRQQIESMWNGVLGGRHWISAGCANAATEAADIIDRQVWRPISEYDAMTKKPDLAIFYMAAGKNGRVPLPAGIIPTRHYGYREITHFMLIDPPSE